MKMPKHSDEDKARFRDSCTEAPDVGVGVRRLGSRRARVAWRVCDAWSD